MRKIYSLFAMLLVAMVANAQVLVSYEHTATAPEGITLGGTTVFKSVKIHENKDAVDCIQLANGYTSEEALNGNCIEVAVDGGFKAGDVVSIAGFFNNSDETKKSACSIYVIDNSESGYSVLWTSEKFINGRTVADEPRVDTYTLEADCEKFYIGRSGNTGTNIYSLSVTRPESQGSSSYTFSASTTPDFGEYVIDQTYFPAAEIATKLGLADAAALYELINTGTAFYLELPDGTRVNEGFTDKNQPWMNAQGVNQGFGDEGTCWFAGIAAEDAEDGTPSVNAWIGDMPGFFKNVYTASDLTAKFYLVNGDKEVPFIFKLHVDAAPEPAAIADPVTTLANVNVVKEYTTTIDFTYGKEYENKEISVDMTDIADALGCSLAAVADNIEKITLTEKMNSVANEESGETTNTPSGELDTPANLAGGSWFGRYSNFDEASGETTTFTQNYSHAWGASATFYVQNIAFAEGTFSFSTGQYMKTMEEGAQDHAVLYILNGDKAAKLTINVNVTTPAAVDPNAMVKVGETTVEVSANVDNNYVTKPLTIDMAPICEALGCEASELADVYAYAQDGGISDNHTEGSGGFYFNEEGKIESWGSSAAFFIAKSSLADGSYTIGQMKDHYTDITEDKTCTAQLIFQNGQNYYVVNVAYTVKAAVVPEEPVTYTCVDTDEVRMQIIPNNDNVWAWENTATIDLEYVKELIGTDDFTLYTDKATTAEDGTVTFAWANNYTCSPYPGFWYGDKTYQNEEGQVVVDNAGWGSNSFGITYASGAITFYQYPGQRSIGDAYTSNLYLVNEENGNYLKLVVNVSYVEEVTPEVETVGTEEVVYEAKEATADGTYIFPLDLTKAIEALELPLTDISNAKIVAQKSQFTFASYEPGDDITFDANGYVTTAEDKIVSMANLSLVGIAPAITVDPMSVDFSAEEAAHVINRVGIEYNGKRYVMIVKIGNAAYTSISSAKTASAASAIYTANGAKANALQKGINIVKYSDGSVKKVYVK